MRELTAALRELSWAVHRRRPARARVGPLTTTAIAMLKQAVDSPGLTVGELAQELSLQQSNVSAAVRLLVQHGYVTREQDATDRRIVRIVPTETGYREEGVVAEAWAGALATAVSRLSPSQREALQSALESIEEVSRQLRIVAREESAPRP
jgi:DNA-binding MarR family transcriptional regulator